MFRFFLFFTFICSILTAGCTAKIDKEITLIKGETTMQEVENMLGSPEKKTQKGNSLLYYYSDSHYYRDLTTGLLTGWKFLDNHVLTLCERGKKKCILYKAKENEKAKSLSVYFKNGLVSNAVVR